MSEVLEWIGQPSCGASVVFTGNVRDHSPGRDGVVNLTYEAYEPWVEPRLAAATECVRRRFPGTARMAALHRIGSLGVGETAMVVAVGSPHREEAFEAGRLLVDTVKETVPLWKYESWSDGEGWSACGDGSHREAR